MNKYYEIPRHTLTRNVKARKKKNYETLLKDLKNKFLRGSLNIVKMLIFWIRENNQNSQEQQIRHC